MSDQFFTGTFEFTQPAKGLFRRPRTETRTLIFSNVHPALYDTLILAGIRGDRRMIHHSEITREEADSLTAAYKAAGRGEDVLDLNKIRDIVKFGPMDGLSEISRDDDMETIEQYAAATGQDLPDEGARFVR